MESSLRSRPSQAPRKAQRTPTRLAKPGAGVTPRDRGKNRVDDKIKKRMSMRYADISSPTHLNGIPPPLPSAGQVSDLAARDADEDLRDRSNNRDQARAASDDKKLLDAEDFDPAACACFSLPVVYH